MNFRHIEMKKQLAGLTLALLAGICGSTLTVDAQRLRTSLSVSGILAPAASSSSQCQNGPALTPNPCAGAAYKGGALNRNNSHYVEGDSIPYQIILTAPAGSTNNTVTLNWDTTKSGVHALDYLTSYDRTESVIPGGNDPCTGTGADCSSSMQFGIPDDTDITNDLPNQKFTMWGGTITGVSPYTLTGTYATTSSRSITVTFDMGQNAGVAVLAVAGHAATRKDWGVGFGSVNISGNPFHFDTGGSQLSVSVGALVANATINVVKLVHNVSGTHFNLNASFPFNSAGGPLPTTFSLMDLDSSATGGGVQSATTTNFGTPFTVQETFANNSGYSFNQALCAIDGAGFPITSTASVDQGTRISTITPGEGNTITCTYENGGGGPTAAKVTIGGRVTNSDGRGLKGVVVSIMDDKGVTRTATTNHLGYYTFDKVEVGRAYIMGASLRRYSFTPRLLTLTDAASDIDFIAN